MPKISALPAAASATLSDIVPAVQSVTTYKETLQQIYDLFLAQPQLATNLYQLNLTTGHEPNKAFSNPLPSIIEITDAASGSNQDRFNLPVFNASDSFRAGDVFLITNNTTVDVSIYFSDTTTLAGTLKSRYANFFSPRSNATVNGNLLILNAAYNIDVVGLIIIASQKNAFNGIPGLTGYNIDFKDTTGTFTSFFTNSNTAARTYTFPDRTGTIADNTDLGLKADKSTMITVTGGLLTGGGDLSVNRTIGLASNLVLQPSNNLSDVSDTTISRGNLGLGSVATQAASAIALTGGTIDGVTQGLTTPALARYLRSSVTLTSSTVLDTTHVDKVIYLNSASAITITVPQQSTSALSAGTVFTLHNINTGTVTVATQGADTYTGNTQLDQYATLDIILRTAGSPNAYESVGGTSVVPVAYEATFYDIQNGIDSYAVTPKLQEATTFTAVDYQFDGTTLAGNLSAGGVNITGGNLTFSTSMSTASLTANNVVAAGTFVKWIASSATTPKNARFLMRGTVRRS